jgi:hypothetical protein
VQEKYPKSGKGRSQKVMNLDARGVASQELACLPLVAVRLAVCSVVFKGVHGHTAFWDGQLQAPQDSLNDEAAICE